MFQRGNCDLRHQSRACVYRAGSAVFVCLPSYMPKVPSNPNHLWFCVCAAVLNTGSSPASCHGEGSEGKPLKVPGNTCRWAKPPLQLLKQNQDYANVKEPGPFMGFWCPKGEEQPLTPERTPAAVGTNALVPGLMWMPMPWVWFIAVH